MTKPGAEVVAASALAIGSSMKRLNRVSPSIYAVAALSSAPVSGLPRMSSRTVIVIFSLPPHACCCRYSVGPPGRSIELTLPIIVQPSSQLARRIVLLHHKLQQPSDDAAFGRLKHWLFLPEITACAGSPFSLGRSKNSLT